MILVGLTGGVATGKTTVARMFRRCGAVIIDADALARELVRPGKPAWRAIARTFGKAILNRDRTINRSALGAIIFASRSQRRLLEDIIHPRVAREQARLTKEALRRNPHAVVVYDVPLLFEAGIDKRVAKTIVVTADRATQVARLQTRNGLTKDAAVRRIRSQFPLAWKRRRADYVLNGTASLKRLTKHVSAIFGELQAQATQLARRRSNRS
jgi:dephospho-CoA kinase